MRLPESLVDTQLEYEDVPSQNRDYAWRYLRPRAETVCPALVRKERGERFGRKGWR